MDNLIGKKVRFKFSRWNDEKETFVTHEKEGIVLSFKVKVDYKGKNSYEWNSPPKITFDISLDGRPFGPVYKDIQEKNVEVLNGL